MASDRAADRRVVGALFLVFAGTHSILAYGNLPLAWELWIGLMGWVLPLGLGVALGLFRAGPLPGASLPAWAFFAPALLILAAAARLWALTDFFRFPLQDEVVNSYFAQHLASHWTWRPFFYWSQLPPLYIWALGLCDKLFGSSPWTLWGLPALLSLLTVMVFYRAARLFSPGALPPVFALLLAASFWPLFLARFSHQVNALLLLEGLGFLAWGKFRGAKTPGQARLYALLWGALVGLGFYTYFAWPLVAFLFLAAFGWEAASRPAKGRRPLALGLLGAGAVLLPLAWGALANGFGNYMVTLLPGHVNPDNVQPESLAQKLTYCTTFLWGGLKTHFAYNPWWGGFLNPVLGALFSLGLVYLIVRRGTPFSRWMALAFAVLFFPVLLANNDNWFHVAPLMPWFLLVAALGGILLVSAFPPWMRAGVALALALLSAGLDMANLLKTRDYVNQHQVSPALLGSYRALEEKAAQEGPGWIFPLFNSSVTDVRLATLVRPFNAAEDSGREAHWAALWTLRRDEPAVEKLFSGTQAWFPIPASPAKLSDELLVFIPDLPANRERLATWVRAHQAFDGLLWAELNCPRQKPQPGLLRTMSEAGPLFEKDPILFASYWDLVSETASEGGDLATAIRAKLSAFHCRPRQTAMDYYRLGLLYLKAADGADAKDCFQKAGALDPDFAPPEGLLENLPGAPREDR